MLSPPGPSCPAETWCLPWRLGGIGIPIFFALTLTSVALLWRALQLNSNRTSAFQLLNLLLMPVLYASSFIAALPTLRGQKEIFLIVLASLGAFALDRAAGGFGGGYVLIPLAALYLRTRRITT